MRNLLLALAVGVSASSAGLAQEPAFPLQERPAAPIGDGYPRTRPWKVLGLHTGMPVEEALAVLRKEFPQLPAEPSVSMRRLPFSDRGFAWTAEHGMPFNNADHTYDRVYLAFSSAVTGNKVTFIRRSISYGKGEPANFEATQQAIRSAYGEPGYEIDVIGQQGFTWYYPVRDGELLKKADPDQPGYHCFLAYRRINEIGFPFYASDPSRAERGLAEAAISDAADADGKCSVLMFVEGSYHYANGIYNKHALQSLAITIIDLKRQLAGIEADNKEIERLQTVARDTATRGKAAPKL